MPDGPPAIKPVIPIAGGSPAEVTAIAMDSGAEEQKNAPPTTTGEEDRKSAGQRGINLLWETTQARIAIAIVAANIVYAFVSPFLPTQATKEMAQVLSNALFAVMGFYFGRTRNTIFGNIKESR